MPPSSASPRIPVESDRSPDADYFRKSPPVTRRHCIHDCCLVLIIGAGLVAIRIMTGEQAELVLHGTYDEVGHLLTALIVAIGIRGRRPLTRVWAILLGGIILDLGHVTDILGLTEPIAGSSRNGSHSLLVVALIAMVALLDPRRAPVWLGLAVGALTHLWRDLGTGYVALAWPVSDQVWGDSFELYVGLLVAIGLFLVIFPPRPRPPRRSYPYSNSVVS